MWLFSGYRDDSEGWRAYLAYISEGMGKLQEWDRAIKLQRKNGSLFNSPSATAAAYTHLKNAGCLKYLHSVLDKYGNSGNSYIFIHVAWLTSNPENNIWPTCSCFHYLVISVPTVFPLDIYVRLCMVDNLGKLGVDRHFKHEITGILDETYRLGFVLIMNLYIPNFIKKNDFVKF